MDKEKGILKNVFRISDKVKHQAKKGSRVDIGDSGEGDKWYGTHIYTSEGQWNKTADVIQEKIKESANSIIQSFQCVESRSLEEERWEDVRFTSLRNLRMQTFYFARFTQVIPGQTHVSREKSVAKAYDRLNQT